MISGISYLFATKWMYMDPNIAMQVANDNTQSQ